MNFLRVQVFPTRIEVVGEIAGIKAYKKALKSKLPNEQFWKVLTFANGRNDIDKHNRFLALGIRHRDEPTPVDKKKVSVKRVKATPPKPSGVVTAKKKNTPTTPAKIKAHPQTIKLWDWTKLTAKQIDEVVAWYSKKRWKDIFILHNDLELSPTHYCCSSYSRHVIFNMEKAKENGII